ncbi:MAG: imidazole glycerol phosphate synthase subunit HisH [Verrucomicrobia bacterium Tous-C9LFEB]|nr:MAG: imidazole glycerol phosphate synthase subunit HisH [Verrucomicrobia bacterium Tous-C9LFEB]
MTDIGIIDYGMGNLRSVANGFESLGATTRVLKTPSQLSSVSHIVLPGVGAFGDGMKNLNAGGWVESLTEEVIRKGKPFLGLCLGMQLLATTGTEYGNHDGLNWIPGTVLRLQSTDSTIRIPHIGWNDVEIVQTEGLYAGQSKPMTFYFVHSYVFQPTSTDVITGICEHGVKFVASVQQNNVHATQFHPEKSQKAGLALLKNFLAIKA